MQLRPDQLQGHLQACSRGKAGGGQKSALAPIYLISGDEPLQVMETGDAIRAAARAAGYEERQVFDVERDFDWQGLATEANSLSLFSAQRLLELRMKKATPGKDGTAVLVDYSKRPADDTILMLVCPRLDARAMRSSWVKALEGAGVLLRLWPIERNDLPRWVDQRLRDRQLIPDPQAVQCLVDRVEGNLLAAAQEIDKLALLLGPGAVSAEGILDVVSDSARFDVFALVDAMLQGDAARAVHVLEGLRAEGVAEAVVLWALSTELRKLAQLQSGIHSGQSRDGLFRKLNVFARRQRLVSQALQRLSLRHIEDLLCLAARVDQAIKGLGKQSAWALLTRLTVRGALLCRPRSPA